MKKFPVTSYVSPGRQNLPVDRRELIGDATGDKIVRAVPQIFTEVEQAIVRHNIGAANAASVEGAVRYDIAQELTDAQSEQARANIWADGRGEWYYLQSEPVGFNKFKSTDGGETWVYLDDIDRYRHPSEDETEELPEGIQKLYCFGDNPPNSENDNLKLYTPTLHLAFSTAYDSGHSPLYSTECTHVYMRINNKWVDVTTTSVIEGDNQYRYNIRWFTPAQ